MKKLLIGLTLACLAGTACWGAAPTVTATDSAPATATPGSTLTYTIVIGATGADATGVVYTDPLSDPNLQLVPNSLRTTPLARPDTYSTIGNVSISISAPGVLANDADPDGVGPALTVTPFAGASTHGGTVNLNSDGSFAYNPPAGFQGVDTFTYTLNDNDTPNQTDTGSVSITVAGMIWFIDAAAGGGGDGRLSNPLNSLGTFNGLNNGAAGHPAANDSIFLQSGAYTGPLTLLNGQKLIGAGAGASLATVTGLTPGTGSAPLPATGGTRPTITLSAAGNNVTLAQGNLIRGLNITTTTGGGTALLGSSVGSLTVQEVSVSNTGGVAVSINGGALNVSFTSISASSAANGIVLTSTTGSFTVTGTGSANSGGTIGTMNGGDGSTAGIGVYMNSATSVSLSWMRVHDCQNWAIRGVTVNGFQLLNSTVDGVNGTSTALQEGSVSFSNLTGTATLDTCNISGGVNDNVTVINDSGTLNFLAVTACSIHDNGANGNDGLHLEAQGTATMTVKVTGSSTFTANRGDHLDFQTTATGATATLVFTGNTLSGGHANGLGQGITIGGIGSMTYNISGNTINGAIGPALNAVVLTAVPTSALGQTMSGTIANNAIGTTGVANSGSAQGNDIVVEVNGPGTHSATVANNILRQYGSGAGLQLTKRNGSGNLNVTVTGNTITEPGTFGVNGILLNSGAATGDSVTSCVDIGGAGALANSIAGSGANGGTDFRVRQRFNTTVQLPGYGGANTDDAAVVAYIQGRNTSSPSGSATHDTSTGGGGFVGGAACGGGANPTLLAASASLEMAEAGRPSSVSGSAKASESATSVSVERIDRVQSAMLTEEQLHRVVESARVIWNAAELTQEQRSALRTLRFSIAELPAGYLADALPGTVRIDRRAAGSGWSTDPEAWNQGAADAMDLLTTVLHEMGHALGLPDATGSEARGRLMYGSLLKGERRLPATNDAVGAVPGTVTSTHFLGGPLTVNIGTLPAGHSITITFQATVANPFTSGCSVATQGTVSGSNFADVLTDDPTAAGSTDPTVTTIPIAPIITCPADIVVPHDPGHDNAVVTFAPSASDPCPAMTVNCVPPSGSTFGYGTTPVTCTATASGLTANCSFNVSVVPDLDFGDAPTAAQSGFTSSYPTTLAQNGARHIIPAAGPALYLGAVPPDSEPDGQPDPNALGDDTHGTADEDGVVLPTAFVAGQTMNITVTASAPGKLDAWIDWNADGDWNDPGEQIFSSRAIVAGPNVLSVTVPAAANIKGGKSFARFRLSSAGGLAPTGQALDGEVEDYKVLLDTPPVAGADVVQRNADEDVKVQVSTLLANDTDAENDTLTLTSVSSPSANGATVTLSGSWVYYQHNGTTPDSFTYTVSDGHGGTATGTVSVTIKDPNAESRDTLSITVDGSGAHIRSDGIPNRTYTIQFRDNTSDPWQDLGTITADGTGIYIFNDAGGSVSRLPLRLSSSVSKNTRSRLV